jgi:putative ABC transport system permease protein
MFIASFSTYTSLTSQINEIERYINYDATLNVSRGANSRTVEREALRVPGVTVAEGWASATGVLVYPDDRESEGFELIGLPYDTSTVDPLLLDGTWLSKDGAGSIVVNEDFLEEVSGVQVGDIIKLKVGDNKRNFQVAGIVSKHLSGARIYLDTGTFSKLTGRQNQVDIVRVLANPDAPGSPDQQKIIAEQLEERFKNAGLSSSQSRTQDSYFGTFTDVFDIILIVLVIMAGLLAVVGGLGLMGTLGINVLERTREIGVLRAIGAANRSVFQVVVIEGLLVGLISWVIGALVSGPSSLALARAVISAVLQTEASFQYSLLGLVFWLLIVLLIGIVSSLAPARKATRLLVRDVLDYE